MKSLLRILQRVSAQPGRSWAMATLVRTRGSTYRLPGALLLIGEDGETLGALSGGCLEDEIGRHGLGAIRDGQARLVSYDTRRLFGCEGQVEILVERACFKLLQSMTGLLARRRVCRVRTNFLVEPLGSELLNGGTLIAESEGVFIHTLPLPIRVVAFGEGPEIEPFVRLCEVMGWVCLPMAHPSQLPGDFQPDRQTAGLVMTHHFGRDFAALERLASMGLPYIGLLGPRKRSARLLAQLQECRPGDAELLETLHAPAGLDIGSEAPEEIALSIASEIAAVLSQRQGGFLRNRCRAIHQKEQAA